MPDEIPLAPLRDLGMKLPTVPLAEPSPSVLPMVIPEALDAVLSQGFDAYSPESPAADHPATLENTNTTHDPTAPAVVPGPWKRPRKSLFSAAWGLGIAWLLIAAAGLGVSRLYWGESPVDLQQFHKDVIAPEQVASEEAETVPEDVERYAEVEPEIETVSVPSSRVRMEVESPYAPQRPSQQALYVEDDQPVGSQLAYAGFEHRTATDQGPVWLEGTIEIEDFQQGRPVSNERSRPRAR